MQLDKSERFKHKYVVRKQGRRRIFKSGPAEEAIVRWVWGALQRKFLNFERFYVRFNGVFMRLGPDFSRFGHKDISCRVRNRTRDKIVFRQLHVFFTVCFLQHVSLT